VLQTADFCDLLAAVDSEVKIHVMSLLSSAARRGGNYQPRSVALVTFCGPDLDRFLAL